MRIYLSAQWSRRDEIEGYAVTLRDHGYEVVSRWHQELMGDDSANSVADWAKWAGADLSDIDTSETFLAFTEPRGTLSRGGRHVEWGYAIAVPRECVVIGPIESQFYALGDDGFPDFAAFLAGQNLHDAPRRESR